VSPAPFLRRYGEHQRVAEIDERVATAAGMALQCVGSIATHRRVMTNG
jgi:hypothetical protein